MIRMKHELHGFHMANSLEEADMRKNGWVEDVPAPVAQVANEPVPLEPVTETAPTPAVHGGAKEKRGYKRKANK